MNVTMTDAAVTFGVMNPFNTVRICYPNLTLD